MAAIAISLTTAMPEHKPTSTTSDMYFATKFRFSTTTVFPPASEPTAQPITETYLLREYLYRTEVDGKKVVATFTDEGVVEPTLHLPPGAGWFRE